VTVVTTATSAAMTRIQTVASSRLETKAPTTTLTASRFAERVLDLGDGLLGYVVDGDGGDVDGATEDLGGGLAGPGQDLVDDRDEVDLDLVAVALEHVDGTGTYSCEGTEHSRHCRDRLRARFTLTRVRPTHPGDAFPGCAGRRGGPQR
jgi:hypothetical protein